MPIITSPRSFTAYTPRAIQPDLLRALRDLTRERLPPSLINRIECYLQVTGQSLSLNEINCESGRAKLDGLLGALLSKRFEDRKRGQRLTHVSRIRNAILQLTDLSACAEKPMAMLNRDGEVETLIDAFERKELDIERCEFWQGWRARNRAGRVYYYELHGMHERFGADFTGQFFKAICDWQQGQMVTIRWINLFSEYLGNISTDIDFSHRRQVSDAVREFIPRAFLRAHERGLSIESQKASERHLVQFLYGHVFGRIWADPLPRIPLLRRRTIPGGSTRVRETSEGSQVKCSLITEVPLQATDEEAMERLFAKIKMDVDLLVRWARIEVQEARNRVERRKKLAPLGTANYIGKTNAPSGICSRRTRNSSDCLNHASATYEKRGFSHLSEERERGAFWLYPSPVQETTWELGIPTSKLLLAHATLLVAAHPQITASFLYNHELFDKNGTTIGFVENDSGFYLVGEKLRRGAELAEQKIRLTAETTQIIRDIVELTTPLRTYLKQQCKDEWRKLFLCADSLGWTPRLWRPVNAANESAEWLAGRLQTLFDLPGEKARDLANNFSLSRLRGSAAVLVYLETGSVQRTAEALGHKRWKPSLLDHYLPRPIQEFFLERWIRLFQMGIICEALKDSPLLPYASDFDTIAELDEFLQNHRLRRIPAHLENPDSLAEVDSDTEEASRLMFGIDSQMLSTLISLEMAVDAATHLPNTLALRWARISKRLIPHLETQSDQPEFHEMVKVARSRADPSKMVAIIHE